jgi:hypothetical protein
MLNNMTILDDIMHGFISYEAEQALNAVLNAVCTRKLTCVRGRMFQACWPHVGASSICKSKGQALLLSRIDIPLPISQLHPSDRVIDTMSLFRDTPVRSALTCMPCSVCVVTLLTDWFTVAISLAAAQYTAQLMNSLRE